MLYLSNCVCVERCRGGEAVFHLGTVCFVRVRRRLLYRSHPLKRLFIYLFFDFVVLKVPPLSNKLDKFAVNMGPKDVRCVSENIFGFSRGNPHRKVARG